MPHGAVPAAGLSPAPGPRRKPRKHDWDAILDDWAAGLSLGQIGAKRRATKGTLASLLYAARQKGDPRAAKRAVNTGPHGQKALAWAERNKASRGMVR